MRERFWLKAGLELFGASLLGAVLYGVVVTLIGDEGTTLREMLFHSGEFLVIFGALTEMLGFFGIYKLTVPLTLSFGATRREALRGVWLMRLELGGLCIALDTLLCLAAGEAPRPLFGLGIFLLCGGIGSLMAVTMKKYGKAAIAVGMILFIAGCFGMGFLKAVSEDMVNLYSGTVSWILLGAGALLQAVMVIPEKKMLDRFAVQL